PHIGNYGVNPDDVESRRPFCAGVLVRELARRPSNWRATESLDDFLRRHHVPGIAGIDTRRLTRHLRESGALPGAFGTDETAVREAARSARTTDGTDLVATVTTGVAYDAPTSPADPRFSLVAYDFGIKATILRRLRARRRDHQPRQPQRRCGGRAGRPVPPGVLGPVPPRGRPRPPRRRLPLRRVHRPHGGIQVTVPKRTDLSSILVIGSGPIVI